MGLALDTVIMNNFRTDTTEKELEDFRTSFKRRRNKKSKKQMLENLQSEQTENPTHRKI